MIRNRSFAFCRRKYVAVLAAPRPKFNGSMVFISHCNNVLCFGEDVDERQKVNLVSRSTFKRFDLGNDRKHRLESQELLVTPPHSILILGERFALS